MKRLSCGFLTALVLCVFFLTGTAFASFPDVPAESPCAPAVAEMEARGLFSGYPDGRFRPAEPISAAQFVTIAVRCAGLRPEPGRTGHWAAGAVDAAVANDLYVIMDWHILSDGTPMTHLEEARTFFAAMAERDCPAVLYETCNEPNGAAAWERDVKPYAEQVIPVIRERSPRAVILVGGSTWSQDIHLAAPSPLEGGKSDVHPAFLRGHPWSGPAPAAGRGAEGRPAGLRLRVGRQPGGRQRRRV